MEILGEGAALFSMKRDRQEGKSRLLGGKPPMHRAEIYERLRKRWVDEKYLIPCQRFGNFRNDNRQDKGRNPLD